MLANHSTASTSESISMRSGQFFDFHISSVEDKNCATNPVKREKRKYRCRKRSPATIERAKTVRRDKANARERRRMNSLNDALEHLRTILPALPDEPKMTKIETLRKAQEYIASLSFQLTSESSANSTSSSPDSSSIQYSTMCDGITCGCCSSAQTTPFQSPCFPPPQQNLYQNSYEHCSPFYSPAYPKP